jgi:hypothetical protein
VVRPVAGVAYVPKLVPEEPDPAVERLTEAIRAALDPQGVFSG